MGHIRTPLADADLEDIWYYVPRRSGTVETADPFVDSITDRFLLLASYPHIGRAREEDLRPGVRSFGVGEYLIIYHHLSCPRCDVVILRVLRASWDLPALFSP